MSTAINTEQFLERLHAQASPSEAANYQRHFQTQAGGYGEGDLYGNYIQIIQLSEEYYERQRLE